MDELARIAQGLAGIENPRELLEGLFAHAPVGFQIYNAAGQSLLVNRAFLQLFGSAPPPEYSIFKDEIAERNGVSPLIRRAFAGETIQLPAVWYDPRELKHVDVQEGRRVAIEISIFPLKDPSGEVRFVALFHKDVTERETLGEALRQSQKLEAVGRLAGGVAHDFNNLLTVIVGYAELLRAHCHPGDANLELVEPILRATERARLLTTQLLAFGRRQAVNPRRVDVNGLVRDLEPQLRRLLPRDTELRIELDSDVGTVRTDPAQLQQVVLNLVLNARDALPDGGRVAVRTEAVVGEVPGVCLSVADTGVG
ncbi:MAG: PAS domain-containing protein, partial [Planctomycetaceae bacterium]|nr:PAS domain-containing protein [Planctomycetaceae bacterium]